MPPLTSTIFVKPFLFNSLLALRLRLPLAQMRITSSFLFNWFICWESCCSGMFLNPRIWFARNSGAVRTSIICLFLFFFFNFSRNWCVVMVWTPFTGAKRLQIKNASNPKTAILIMSSIFSPLKKMSLYYKRLYVPHVDFIYYFSFAKDDPPLYSLLYIIYSLRVV